jgi:hypothetical protein
MAHPTTPAPTMQTSYMLIGSESILSVTAPVRGEEAWHA